MKDIGERMKENERLSKWMTLNRGRGKEKMKG